MGSKRITWLDIGKGIAIIGVVLGHSIAGLDSPLKHAIFTFHMPLFFIYAGITFRVKPMRQLLGTSARRLLVPYVLLFSVAALFLVLNNQDPGWDFVKNVGASFVFASAVKVKPWGFWAAGMIWFLVVLFISRVLTNACVSLFERLKAPLPVQLLVMVVFTVAGVTVSRFCYLPLSFDLVPLACLYVFCGYAVKERDLLDRATSWPAVLVSLVVWALSMHFCWFSMGDRMFAGAPLAILGSFAGTIIISKCSQLIDAAIAPLATYLAFMGRNSLLVFALHYLEQHIIPWSSFPFVAASGNPWYLLFAARFAFIMIVMVLLMYMPLSRAAKQKPAASEPGQ